MRGSLFLFSIAQNAQEILEVASSFSGHSKYSNISDQLILQKPLHIFEYNKLVSKINSLVKAAFEHSTAPAAGVAVAVPVSKTQPLLSPPPPH